ncbi:MAG: DUF4019 domain-containing protein [Methylacidiphilales bacterium]|nr:DUF4019 domain-containing protein [Candidatus Methylacidiphilales bacterium]
MTDINPPPAPEDVRKCPECGTPLQSGALAGLCPACLLKLGAAGDTLGELVDISALEALCKICEIARPDSVWELAGYKESRMLSLSRGRSVENQVVGDAQGWLVAVDRKDYAHSWQEASVYFKAAVTEPGWTSAMNTYRKPLGEANSRKLLKAQAAKSLPGAPDGEYVVMQFDTSFSAKKSAVETVTFMLEKDGHWRAVGYFIK